jgi:hypothetical protein
LLIASGVLALVTCLITASQGLSPLDQLETRALKVPATAAGFRARSSNRFFWDVIDLQFTIEQFLGASVEYAVPMPGTAGMTSMRSRQVIIDATLSWDDRLPVLAHEGGHLLAIQTMSGTDQEVFADGVSFLVCRKFGEDTLNETAHHLAMYKASLHVLRDARSDIEWAAAVLSGR